MAIKVGGTSVVDNSRNLKNIASIDATTEAAITSAGFTKTTGDITAVTAGSGLTGGGTSGSVTLNHQDTSSQGSVNNSGNTVIQDILLDTYGHVTTIRSTTISASASTSAGAVGTYMFAGVTSLTNYGFGATLGGSSLRPAGITGQGWTSTGWVAYGPHGRQNTAQSGTWRCMGRATAYSTSGRSAQYYYGATLWVRIS